MILYFFVIVVKIISQFLFIDEENVRKKIKENQARMHEDKQLVCLRAIYYDCVGASSHTHLIKIHFQFN